MDIKGGGRINVTLNRDTDVLAINTQELKNKGEFNLMFSRFDEQNEEPEVFFHGGVKLDAESSMDIDYAGWKGEGRTLLIEVDKGDGTPEDTIEITDEVVEETIETTDDTTETTDGEETIIEETIETTE